jgi:threonine aldolase
LKEAAGEEAFMQIQWCFGSERDSGNRYWGESERGPDWFDCSLRAKARSPEPFDTVSVCFSKALGAPVGSCLAGPKPFIDRARRFKQQFGGGFRQAGIIAAGALYALEHHRARLRDTHARATAFARKIASYPEVDIDPATVETNIVRFRLRSVSAAQFVDEAYRLGVDMLPSGPNAVRAVFYLDITESDVERASELFGKALHSLDRFQAEKGPVTSTQY